MLAYVESCCVDGRDGVGTLDRRRVRCNANTHPMLSAELDVAGMGWKLSYSTRLAGFFDFAERSDPEKAIAAGLQLRDHDDWDCLDDLEAAGYVETLSLVNGFVKMTPLGCEVAAKLRAHKAEGGHFAGFRLNAEPQPALACAALCREVPTRGRPVYPFERNFS